MTLNCTYRAVVCSQMACFVSTTVSFQVCSSLHKVGEFFFPPSYAIHFVLLMHCIHSSHSVKSPDTLASIKRQPFLTGRVVVTTLTTLNFSDSFRCLRSKNNLVQSVIFSFSETAVFVKDVSRKWCLIQTKQNSLCNYFKILLKENVMSWWYWLHKIIDNYKDRAKTYFPVAIFVLWRINCHSGHRLI